jgi:hypothetical protein
MWRFLLISFAVLGWTFYELSGGADYAPAPNSLQAQGDPDRPEVPAPGEATPRAAPTHAGKEAVMTEPGAAEATAEALPVTLATPRTAPADRARPDQGAEGDASAIDAAIAAAMGEAPADAATRRRVKDGSVDLREGPGLSFDTVTRLSRGTEVAVVEDPGHGWLKVRLADGYRTGWLAEWLVTAPE